MEALAFVGDTKDFFITRILWVIAVLAFFALLFFLLAFIKRTKGIKLTKKKRDFQEIIDPILFTLLFEDSLKTTDVVKLYSTLPGVNTKLFKRQVIKSIVSLHRSFSGEQQRLLSDFFIQTNLIAFAQDGLRSKKWIVVVEAIRNLSELDCIDCFDQLKGLLRHKNKLVRSEAYLGMVRLRGFEAIHFISETNLFFNDWLQSNVFFITKTKRYPAPASLEFIFRENQPIAVLLFGARIIDHYSMLNYMTPLRKAVDLIPEGKEKRELSEIIHNLTLLQSSTL